MFILTAEERIEYTRLLDVQKNCERKAYQLAKQFKSHTISVKEWTAEMDALSRKIKETETSIKKLMEIPVKIVDGQVIIE